MYEAIVALPLLGAIIAGVITLFGAAQRNPGEDPPPPMTIMPRRVAEVIRTRAVAGSAARGILRHSRR